MVPTDVTQVEWRWGGEMCGACVLAQRGRATEALTAPTDVTQVGWCCVRVPVLQVEV